MMCLNGAELTGIHVFWHNVCIFVPHNELMFAAVCRALAAFIRE